MTTPKNFLRLMKKYGPGFVAFSKKSGRVLAYGKDIKKLWENAEKRRVDFSKIVISHIPKYGTVSLYWEELIFWIKSSAGILTAD